jgi:O-antigen ligase
MKMRAFSLSEFSANGDPSRPAYIFSLILLCAAFLMAGGARDDLTSLLVWRPLSTFVLAFAVAFYWRQAWQNSRNLMLLCCAIVALPTLQLIPLPPDVWTALPGRELIAAIYRDAGMALPWQPLSVAQARTWNALFSLAAPLGFLIFALALNEKRHHTLLLLLIGIGFFSGIVGLVQAIGPTSGPFYFYRITNNGLAVGLFANRNHQAGFLAMMYPLLAAFLTLMKGKPDQLFFQRSIALAGALLLIPLILMSGSRGGFILTPIGMLLGFWVYKAPVTHLRSGDGPNAKRVRYITYGLIGAFLAVVTIAILRTSTLDRLIETESAGELRIQALPIVMHALDRFFPAGSGLGTFVEVYKIYEPNALISEAYFNHAHNDFVELLLTAGLLGALLLIWIGAMMSLSLRSLIRNRRVDAGERGYSAQVLGRAGFSILTMLALSSAVDYPLRVPSLMLLGIVAAVWCSAAYRSAQK